ncbi:MAG TPA: PAS domain-containing sensor histidine kinase [Alphaproteobacteria bacterium]
MQTRPLASSIDMRRLLLRRAALFAAWTERHALGNRLVLVLIALAFFMGIMTYRAMTPGSIISGDTNTLILFLNIDLVVLLMLIAAVAHRVVALWNSSRKRIAGSALQAKLVWLFSILVAFPAIVTTVFSVGLFYYGIHGWFDQRVRTAVDESLAVAQAYLSEHQQVIRADILGMAADLDRESMPLSNNPRALEKMLEKQSFFRNFSEVIVFNSDHHILAQSGLTLSMEFSPISDDLMERAANGDVAIDTGEQDDRIRALVKLQGYGDGVFLYAGRMVDEKVLAHLDTTKAAVSQYQELSTKSGQIQVTITGIYVVVVLLMMTIAIWFGLALARRLVDPIGVLINAADRLREGDLTARVPEIQGIEELETLGRTFNRMTEEIERQRNELIEANKRLDYRRRFTETVLGGVSTGIMGVDSSGIVTLANPAAGQLLKISNDRLIGQKLDDVLPESLQGGKRRGEHEISVLRRDGARRRFMIRVSTELVGETGHSTVLAFDDITDLVAAQKSAAWADVARRIAHEIKNPLTPIQLSAERIKRKYLDQLTDENDRDILQKCTDTIVRHVEDIKTMVNAFSGFAKMPEPAPMVFDLLPPVQEVMALQSQANPSIDFDMIDKTNGTARIHADQQLVRQALTNLVQNAADAVENTNDPVLAITITESDDVIWLGVLDNGPGIPMDKRDAVLEPYVTTKAKGTGLGLAIVKKIAEDHGGRIVMDDPMPLASDIAARYTGAHFYLSFPKADQVKTNAA